MAIEALGITPDASGMSSRQRVDIRPTTPAAPLRVSFITQTRAEVRAFDIAVAAEVVQKGSGGWCGFMQDSAGGVGWWWRLADASELTCKPNPNGPGFVWSIPLSFTSEGAMAGSAAATLWGNAPTYTGRRYDAVHLVLKAKAYYGPTNPGRDNIKAGRHSLMVTPVTSADAWVVYAPDMQITGASYDRDGLTITHTHPGWERNDGRFEVEWLEDATGRQITQSKPGARVWGTVRSAGSVCIPPLRLLNIPRGTDTLKGAIRFNASYLPAGAVNALDRATFSGVAVADRTTCNPVDIKVQPAEEGVRIVASDAGGSNPAARIDVHMLGYEGEWARARVVPGRPYLFRLAPFDTAVCFEATGIDADGDPGPTTISAPVVLPSKRRARLDAVDGSAGIEMRYNYKSSGFDAEPVFEVQHFAGRARPSVGFGIGASVTSSVSFSVVTASSRADVLQRVEDVHALADVGGPVILREPGGRLWLCAVASVSAVPGNDGAPKYYNVDIKLTGVQ